jgi:hypothetical protein
MLPHEADGHHGCSLVASPHVRAYNDGMYSIVDVTADVEHVEPMGSKPKFWFEHPTWGTCLFKTSRPLTGEDWSEKLAERFASRLGIPHARYELASCRNERGVVTPRLTTDEERLVHGNEMLIELDPDYSTSSAGYRTPLHTVPAVIAALTEHRVAPPKGWPLPEGLNDCNDVFVGYLLLDALIGNTDRHHENWAAIEVPATLEVPVSRYLAPTFDHASSLGRNEPLAKVNKRLHGNDVLYTVETYARHARSAFFLSPDEKRPLSPLDAFAEAKKRCLNGAMIWCDRLSNLGNDEIQSIVDDVPSDRMEGEIKRFVVRLVSLNRDCLLQECQRS